MSRRVSRRDVLALAGLSLLPAWARAQEPDPEVMKIVDAVIGVDMHSHAGGVHYRAGPGVDLAGRMREGRMTAACWGHTSDGPVISRQGNTFVWQAPRPGQLWQHTLERLDFIDGVVRSQGLRRILKRGDLEQAHKHRAPSIVQMIEGADFLEGRLERIAEVHRRGVRQLQLVHFLRSDLGDRQTEAPQLDGLSGPGREAIAECNRLGLVIDTAHGTIQMVEMAAKASRTPLIFSHTHWNPRPGPFSRAVSSEHMKLVAQTGGVTGIWSLHATGTLADFVDRIARAVAAAGIDHVGLGSDVGGSGRNVWHDYAAFPEIVGLMRKKGFSAADIGKIAGGNYVRVFNASVSA